MDYGKRSLEEHQKYQGKLTISSLLSVTNKDELSIAYSPGVGDVSSAIAHDKSLASKLTMAGRTVLVVSDGSAVLGLGNVGPEAALPVMEGKCVLMKEFAGIDAMPLVLNTQNPDEIISIIENVAPTFAAVNLEDIKAPECFYIEEALSKLLPIPVFHDDQHGTAIVVLAGLLNALKVVNKEIGDAKIVINGAGAAGVAIAKLLLDANAGHLTLVDSRGVVNVANSSNAYKQTVASHNNYRAQGQTLGQALIKADVFIGVSKPNTLDGAMIKSMNNNPIIFALANPIPEIMPEVASDAGAAIVATGRSDYPNQVNNVLVFPGIFKGLIESGQKKVTELHKLNAAKKLADLVPTPTNNLILPNPFNPGIATAIAKVFR